MTSFKTKSPRPNGLPPLERTWWGIGPYRAELRPSPLAHVVCVMSEGEPYLWLIDDLTLMPDLMRMLADLEYHVDSYSVLRPLPAFTEY
jgi:hypothetical protein